MVFRLRETDVVIAEAKIGERLAYMIVARSKRTGIQFYQIDRTRIDSPGTSVKRIYFEPETERAFIELTLKEIRRRKETKAIREIKKKKAIRKRPGKP